MELSIRESGWQRKGIDEMIGKKKSAVLAVSSQQAPVLSEADFRLKNNSGEIAIDANFAAQSFWKDAAIRYFRKASAVFGLIMILLIAGMAVVGPGMNDYTYSGQTLTEKNLAPRVKGLEQLGIFDGSEKIRTTTGSKL